jgi:hypothetical protein
MNASSLASRFASLCAVLGFLLVADAAQAQFLECVEPTDVPDRVLNTILEEASFIFGAVEDKVCTSIVKEGVKTCKAQVKGAAKCLGLASITNYKIQLKQCQELEDPQARADCKAEFNATRDLGKAKIEEVKNDGLVICEDSFAEELSDACLGILP